MKRTLTLLAVTVLTVNSVGCCCCRGMRDWCFQGALFGPRTAAVAPAPLYATGPAPTYAATPFAAPTQAVPVFPHCTPQSPCAPQQAPQYALAQPTQVPYSDMSYAMPYMGEMGCGTPYVTEMDCCCSGSDGMIIQSPEMFPGPGPE